jgi:CRP-like cAMP-binding protein
MDFKMYIAINVKAHEVVIKEGDPADCVYILKDGELEILSYDHDSKSHQIVGHIEPGEMFGEMSFLDNLPRSATVRAVMDSKIYVINRAEFDKIYKEQHPMMQQLVSILSERLRKTNKLVKF